MPPNVTILGSFGRYFGDTATGPPVKLQNVMPKIQFVIQLPVNMCIFQITVPYIRIQNNASINVLSIYFVIHSTITGHGFCHALFIAVLSSMVI